MGPVKSVSVITVISILMSVAITLFIYFVFGREVPGIVLLIAVIAPLIIAPIVSSLLVKLVIEKEVEKKRIYKASANEAKEILRGFLHDVQYFESEAERIGGFDGNTMQHLEGALKKTKDKLNSLDDAGDLTVENKIMHE
jgi:Mn2+/Fe2+ NRAMP family transporter